MKQAVVVNGVTLTAEQVKGAWEEINKPDPQPELQPGDLSMLSGGAFYVTFKDADSKLRQVNLKSGGIIGASLTGTERILGNAHEILSKLIKYPGDSQ